MNPRLIKSWERTRNKGKVRFLIFFSFWLTLFMTVAMFLPDLVIMESFTIGYVLYRIILMLAVSVTGGLVVWSINESRFTKAIASQPQEEEPTQSE